MRTKANVEMLLEMDDAHKHDPKQKNKVRYSYSILSCGATLCGAECFFHVHCESTEQKLQRFIAREPSRIKITFCKQRRIKEVDNLNAKSLAHFVNHP